MFRELDKTQNALIEYIEATYHITNERLLERRRRLLETNGVISQLPYIESTAKYEPGREYADLDLPESVKELLTRLSTEEGGKVVFNPPYSHQADALEAVVGDSQRNLIVTTGTGSGKTETFLLPILSRLAREASADSAAFQQRAVRALLLYPMNALVNDQLGRLRLLFGAPATAQWFVGKAGRPAKFGRYTSRTPFPGVVPGPDDTSKLTQRFRGMKFYFDLEQQANAGDQVIADMIQQLKERGKWPAKTDPTGGNNGFSTWYRRGRWHNDSGELVRAVERTHDPELLTRFEIQNAPPDLLVTNYSMLEYMMLRPIERSIFDLSRDYYAANPHEKFLLVLDEAHLYRGAQGTEVAMLIRRLRSRLGLTPERLQVICTSASFEDSERAKEFAAGLSGTDKETFIPLNGDITFSTPSGPGNDLTAEILSNVNMVAVLTQSLENRLLEIKDLSELNPQGLKTYSYNIKAPEDENAGRPGDNVTVHGLGIDFEPISEVVKVAVGEAKETSNQYLAITRLESQIVVEAERSDGNASLVLLESGELEIPRDRDAVSRVLFDILSGLEVTGRLLNLTSGAEHEADPETLGRCGPAREVSALAKMLFPDLEKSQSESATDRLIELASSAKSSKGGVPLLAARVHRFYRGLPGIWACSSPACDSLPAAETNAAPVGSMYVQPVRTCDCGSRVFEVYTCRTCGSAYFHAWSTNPDKPDYLWHQDVGEVDEVEDEVQPVHVLLEDPNPYFDPSDGKAQKFDERYLDPLSGRLFDSPTETTRPVWMPPLAIESTPGQFCKCPRCQTAGRGDRSEIQDLKTKGDEPFQQLIASQLLEQPPRPDIETPLKGRKALIFSDGRQPASRLAGKLGSNSLRDSIRPLLLDGYRFLRERWSEKCDEIQSLRFAYIALHCGAFANGVTLNPQLKSGEGSFFDHRDYIQSLIRPETDWDSFSQAADALANDTPHSIFQSFYEVLFNKQTGIHSLALGCLVPRLTNAQSRALDELPAPPTPDGVDESERRRLFLSLWIRLMAEKRAIFIPGTPIQWVDSTDGARLNLQKGKFATILRPLVTSAFYTPQFATKQGTSAPWIRFLSTSLGCSQIAGKFLLNGSFVGLADPGETCWQRCSRCSWVQPKNALAPNLCFGCSGDSTVLDLDVDNDPAFQKRKAFYRRLTERLSEPDRGTWSPHPFVAKEHTAAIGSVDSQKSFSLAEWYEMRFQDLDVPGPVDEPGGAVDVLSCTTTMEVGIDIGSLTAVSMRNVPPNRANYQQRAGRAGRRGSSLSTVITYADQGSHDQKFFSDPAAMISGPVTDPILNLDNPDIVLRHGFAFILGLFQQERIGDDDRENANIFSSLGMVDDFRRGAEDEFSYRGLEQWIQMNTQRIQDALIDLLPSEFVDAGHDPTALPGELLCKLEEVGAGPLDQNAPRTRPEDDAGEDNAVPSAFGSDWEDFGEGEPDAEAENDEAASDSSDSAESPDAARDVSKLLDLLFDKAVLPSYAFPTDVVSMTVFDRRSEPYRTIVKYAPQRGLSQALSSYAPGREIYIDGYRHLSFAIWSPFRSDRYDAWSERQLYFECSRCGYVQVEKRSDGGFEGEARNCPACSEPKGLGPAVLWMTPPGFAHPYDLDEKLVDDPPELTRPTHAKLSAKFDQESDADETVETDGRGFLKWARKEDLYITNSGSRDPQNPGFRYCTFCGRIEPNGWTGDISQLSGGSHAKPFPEHRGRDGGPVCTHRSAIKTTTLGTKFRSDVVLFRLKFGDGIYLAPGSSLARIGLGTLANAMSATVVRSLEIERGNVGGEYRPALTSGGENGSEVDVYLYDTTAGGAGFVQAATQNAQAFMEATLELLEECTCTHSCYRCLHTYENRYFHGDLDRKLAASILKHILGIEAAPRLDDTTEIRLLRSLERDLNDSGQPAVLKDGFVELTNQDNKRIVLAHSLAPNNPGSEKAEIAIQNAPSHTPLAHLLVERALPIASRRAAGFSESELGANATANLPVVENGGVEVFDLDGLKDGWDEAESKFRIDVGMNRDGIFILHLTEPVLEKTPVKVATGRSGTERVAARMEEGSLLIMQRIEAIPPTRKMNGHIAIVHHENDVFRATKLPTTIGYLQVRGEDRIRIGYSSSKKKCQPEILNVEGINVLGVVRGIYVDGKVIEIKKELPEDE